MQGGQGDLSDEPLKHYRNGILVDQMELNLQPLWTTLPLIIITLLSQETEDRLGPLAELITKLVNKSAALGEVLSPYKKLDVFPPPLTEPFETYDFVIVGASPSGAALANRLTEIGKWNVILLEAGGMPNIFTDIPVFAQTPSFTSNCWDSYAEPQEEHCRGCIDHCMKYPKGKGLGGSSIINFMIYTRGNKIDYDKWAAMGNPGWSYEDVLPYFIKAEDSQFAYQDIEYHGRGGYMKVGFTQTFTRDGKRIQGENAYLRPVRERRNLRVRTGAHVTKVLIKPDTNEAYGVEYVKDGIKYQVYARNEVILSAGSMKTPQILMLSGIGPKDHLLELVIGDNPGISLSQRFNYLRLSLKNEALDLLKNLEISPENYNIAWQLLYDAYDNNTILVNQHVQGLFDLPVVKDSNNLKMLLNELNKHLRALKSLNQPIEYWDRLLIPMIVNKLDPHTRKQWFDKISFNELPSLDMLKNFIDERAKKQAVLNKLQSGDNPKIPGSKTYTGKTRNFLSNEIICKFCAAAHYINQCKKFLALTPQKRFEEVRSRNLCVNCLKANHNSKACGSSTCRTCRKKHHTLLHFPQSSDNTPSPSSSNVNDRGACSCAVDTSNSNNINSRQNKEPSSSGIPVVKDLPVGQLMYDHSTALVVTYVLNEGITVVTPRDLIDPATYGNYLLDGRGPLSLSGTVEALTYIKTNVTDPEYPTWPDIELIFSCGSPVTEFGTFLRPLFNIPRETFNLVWKPITGKPAITVLAQLMHPRSVGYIRLRSINPFDEPRYFTNFLSDPENKDIRAHVAAIREIQRIGFFITGCANFTFDTDEYWECAVRELTASFWHQQATCKMGPKDDKEAVVDARLRVHGMNKLRVVDTGIIPRSISAHLTGPAFMIGEKGADIIKQDWGELLVQKTQSEPESKLESKSNSESHLEPELKSESKSHSEPQLEAELESHSESQLGSELKAESKSQPESQLKPELKSHSEPQLRPELEPHSESQLGSELKTESKSQPESQLEPELKSHSDSQLVPELKSHSESQLGPELKSNSESQLEPALEPESKSQSEAQSEPESKSQSEAHMVTENKAPQS
nr:unnamed protein product [Callosobruchus chinensis]